MTWFVTMPPPFWLVRTLGLVCTPPYALQALTAYAVSLLIAMEFAELYAKAQPALIYLIPGCLGTTCLAAFINGDFKDMWHGAWALKKKTSMASDRDREVLKPRGRG